MYWGLYEFQERPEANFGASYIGGKKENFDVIKVAADNGMKMEATDGTMAKYKTLCDLTLKGGFAKMENYYKLQGLDSKGKVDTTLEVLVDIDNLIDYMLNIFYSGNFDSPMTAFSNNNNNPNNLYCIKNRNHTREGFIFIVHDAEHTFHYVPGGGDGHSNGVNQNRVNLYDQGMDTVNFTVDNFTPNQLHAKLMANAEYRLRFADRAQKYLFNNGLLTPDKVEEVLRNRANQISDAVVCESARLGDSRGGVLRTRDKEWNTAIENTVQKFIKLRTPIVIEQLKKEGLLDSIVSAPDVYIGSNLVNTQSYDLSSAVDITFENSDAGTIYYTLDGSDPKLTGWYAYPKTGATPVNISSPLVLKARIWSGSEWGPMRELTFTNKNNRENLRITEIQYNPSSFGSQESKDLEFIEIKTIGDQGIDMSGLKLDSAIHYKFPEGTIINPHSFVVIASEKNGFEFLYKIKPTGQFTGNLGNDGDRVVLVDENNKVLIDVKYGVTYPWPVNVNGSGFSLVSLTNPVEDPNNSSYWHSSKLKYGSPFYDDSTFTGIGLKSTIATTLSVFPVPTNDNVNIKGNNIKKVELYDLNGKLLWINSTRNQFSTDINLSFNSLKAAQGVYLLKVYGEKDVTVRKLIYKK
jgi:hypothetical protein